MRIRSQLETFSHAIADQANSWNGTEDIHFSVPVKETEEHIDSVNQMCQSLQQRVAKYVAKDESLLGKIETLSDLSSSLSQISSKAYSLKPWYKKVLSVFGLGLSDSEKSIKQVKSTVDSHIRQFRDEKSYIESGESKIMQFFGIKIRDTLLSALSSHSTEPKRELIKNAFRVVKEVDSVTQVFLDQKFGGAQWSDATHEIRQDFEDFYNLLSPELKKEAAPFLRTLRFTEELGKHITVCASLMHMKRIGHPLLTDTQIDRYIRQQSADIAYVIEKAVKALPVGESIVIPGGYSDAEGGHAVSTKIKKIEPGQCQIACYNTGLGAEEGQGFFGTIAMYMTWNVKVPTFEPVPVRTAVKQAMLINLLDLTPKDWQPPIKVRNFMQNAKVPVAETPKDSIRLQTWGTCSFDSVLSYLSHDVPSGLFLLYQLHSMQNANERIKAALPTAEQENYFNSATIDLLKTNPDKTISEHTELCRKTFDRFLEHAKFVPDSETKIKEELASLQQLNKTSRHFITALWSSQAAAEQDKIREKTRILQSIREIVTIAAPPSQKAEILKKSNDELTSWLLETDLSFIFRYIKEMRELSSLFQELVSSS